MERVVAPWNWGSVNCVEVPLAATPGVFAVVDSLVRGGELRVLRWPSLCTAQCSFIGAAEPWLSLMTCFREGSGMFRPKRASKESRLRYVRRADMRAAPSPANGGSWKA